MTLSTNALVSLLQAKSFLKIDATASLHVPAEYVGAGTGTEDDFTLDHTPVEGTLQLYVDNILQVETTNFTLTTNAIKFVLASIPGNGKIITASYDYAASSNTFESYDDDILERLIETATKLAEDYTGRVFVNQTITENRIGDGLGRIMLYKRPVTDITSVTVAGTALTEWTERLSIGRIYADFPIDDEVVIVYTAGYGVDRNTVAPLVPQAVSAVLVAVAALYNNRQGLQSESISGIGSVDFGELGLPEQSRKLLQGLKV